MVPLIPVALPVNGPDRIGDRAGTMPLRLVAPRGYNNPSITDTEGMSSEGVGSFWPFSTGRRVTPTNLLLRQIQATPRVSVSLV